MHNLKIALAIVLDAVIFLQVAYGISLRACHGEGMHVACSDQDSIIVVESANYGRKDRDLCGGKTELIQPCVLASSLAIINSRCFGRRRCEILATNSEFADPCPGISKYLEVQYECVKKTDVYNVCDTPLISQPSGYAISPGYPKPYKPMVKCLVHFKPVPQMDIRVTFIDLELEARMDRGCFDWLILREEEVEWMKHDYCGNMLTKTGLSIMAFDKLNLLFKTDGMNQYRGFLLKFDQIPTSNRTKGVNDTRPPVDFQGNAKLPVASYVAQQKPLNSPYVGPKSLKKAPKIEDNQANRELLDFIKKHNRSEAIPKDMLRANEVDPIVAPVDPRPRAVGIKQAVESMLRNEGGCSEEQARFLLPVHGTLHHFKEGKIFHIKCSAGYKISDEDDAIYVCSRNAWVGAGTALCLPYECPRLAPLVRGQLTYPDTRHGSQAEYRCDPGYRLFGDATRTCLRSSQWSGSEPICKAVKTYTQPPSSAIPMEIPIAVALTLLFFICKKRICHLPSRIRSKLI